ncbi:MAG: Dam family site-specific DNA-(adenine-N6)-methyltransferase [Chloroflexota bacterium]|nr:Dam family site-specific DNA-(adenine-N6)-methyltransferase [Chloroflexota bacterium]
MQQLIFGIKTEEAVVLQPPLKWAGGKRWLLPRLLPIWEQYKDYRLVEPFVGGIAVALGLLPDRALLNDTNPHLINFYCWLQQGLVVESEMANDKELYYRHRRRFNQLIHENRAGTKEAASLFYYMNRTCFNGLCRFNGKGFFNVPFGSYKTINYTYDFTRYANTLSQWTFSCGDFGELPLEENDLLYADPPYDVEFTSYTASGFDWQDQRRLARWLASHPGPVIASNQATARILDLYASLGFDIQTLEAPRMISCNGDRTPAIEMLATKGT